MVIDPRTFLFCMGLFSLSMAIIAFSVDGTFERSKLSPLKLWSAAMALMCASFWLFAARGIAPDMLTRLLPNNLVICLVFLLLWAYTQFFGLRFPLGIVASLLALSIVVNSFADKSGQLVMLISLEGAVFLSMSALTVFKHANLRASFPSVLSFASLMVLSVAMVGRFVISLAGSESVALYSSSTTSITFYIVLSIAIVFSSIGLILMVNEKAKTEILLRSRVDGLTGLYTRSAFFELAAKIIERNPETPYSVLMVDIDHFKRINDKFGHASGDVALMHAARLVMQSSRVSDLSGRYGGEEFCIFLSGCGEVETARIATQLINSARTSSVRIPNGDSVSYTFSAGYAWSSKFKERRKTPTIPFGGDVAALLDQADKALYLAKNSGRNQALPFTAIEIKTH